MPAGGDPVKELGPYVAKGCAVVVCGGLVALIILGVLVGMAM